FHRSLDQRRVIGLEQQRFRIARRPFAVVLLFIERVGQCLESATAPATTGVANDSEEPGTAVSARKCAEVPKGPQRRLLHDVFSIVLIPHQPACQAIASIEVGQYNLLKTAADRVCCVGSTKSISHGAFRGLAESIFKRGIKKVKSRPIAERL